MTHILLAAVFAAGLSACSGEGTSSAPSAAPAAAETSPAPAAAETAADSPAASAAETAAETSPAASAEPTAGTPDEGDGAGDTGPAVALIGTLGVDLSQPGWITVQLDGGDTQPVMLSPGAVVLDVQGAVCDEGKLPHKCTAAQLEKALKAGKSFYAKVTLKGGVAMQVEEIVQN
ncbi:hypothetical protein GCM10010517_07830 [Streptosporangium fragile]|uniref:Uncharacterized protein n=1 Tax=Streptosporangium fragile TaxID=46186 RepID=A0ABP6I8Y0_9ACTN